MSASNLSMAACIGVRYSVVCPACLTARLVLGFATQRQIGFDCATQDNHPARFVPARQLECVFDGAPALVAGPGCGPVITRELACQQFLDPCCLAQFEQVGLGTVFQLCNEGLIAKAAVSSDQGRA